MNALIELIDDLGQAQKSGTPQAQVDAARDFQRAAQFYIDYVEAENSMGFHAPGEVLRVLAEATDFVRKGQLALRGVKVEPRRSKGRAPAVSSKSLQPRMRAGERRSQSGTL
jgi:nitrite reductase (cytochrome c-552)